MAHIYYCEKYNDEKYQKLEYECIYTGSIQEQITVFKKFEENLNKRENLKVENKVKPPCDPLSCLVDSNGYIYIYINIKSALQIEEMHTLTLINNPY